METFITSEHCPPFGCDSRAIPICFGLDIWRGAADVPQHAPVCRSAWSGGLELHNPGTHVHTFSSCLTLRTVLVTYILTT